MNGSTVYVCLRAGRRAGWDPRHNSTQHKDWLSAAAVTHGGMDKNIHARSSHTGKCTSMLSYRTNVSFLLTNTSKYESYRRKANIAFPHSDLTTGFYF